MHQKRELTKEEFLHLIDLNEQGVSAILDNPLQFMNNRPAIEQGSIKLLDVAVSNISLQQRDCQSMVVNQCIFSNATFIKCNFHGTMFLNSSFASCSFIECEFVKAEMSEIVFENANFSGSDLRRVEFFSVKMPFANLSNCDLSGCRLFDSDIRFVNLENTNFAVGKLITTKIYNERKFKLGPPEHIVIKDVDVSPNGDGSAIAKDYDELMKFLG